jgi:tetratricopeptide (TPR) repeat protein
LIEVATDSHLWSDTYDRQMENIFAVQDDIANSVAGSLKVALEGGQTLKLQRTNPEAYNAYLQGRFYLERRSTEDLEMAIRYFDQALKIDSSYARAWVGLSRAHFSQTASGVVSVAEGGENALKEAQKALKLDPNIAETHAAMAWVKTVYLWDWAGADASYKRALELEPTNADIVRDAAMLAHTLGRFDEAIVLARKAIELDPLSVTAHYRLGFHSYYAGRFSEAETAFRKVLELNPQRPETRVQLGRISLAQSKPQEALAEIQKEPHALWREYGLALAYHALRKEKEADAALAEYIKQYHNDAAFQIAEIYAYRGETDKAFEWLERAYNQKDGGLSQMKGDPQLRSLHRDPRWPAFLKKMKLPLD